MHGPDQAVVLAAGLGTRLRPVTQEVPKPLVKVAGEALIDRILDRLAAAGIKRVVVNTHHLAEKVEAHLAGRGAPAIEISREEELLETGGGVAKAMARLEPGPFYVINGDVLWLDGTLATLERLAAAWRDAVMDALLLLHPVAKMPAYKGMGDFFLDQLGKAVRRRERQVAPFVFTGIQLLHPRLFEDAPRGPFSLNRLYDRAEAAGRLFGLVHGGEWFHVSTPESLAWAEAELTRGNDPSRP
jgi:MurNAc alpha-1-phosphate uridylyltransferase